ncbi:MAG: HAMP domain-containing protein [Desulfuromonadales bacterium]|jgi:two-component system sensor histidine kinase BaeS|nr:HAMP domain-containing protein [Desulfuromonadales bacterium]
MQFSIKYKLTFAMLGGICIVVICMHLFGQWSFDRGFLRYVNSVEKPRLELLSNTLEETYSEQGSWDFLRDNPVAWLKILASTFPGQQADPEFIERLGKQYRDGKFPPQHGLSPEKERLFEMRVLLFDTENNLIFGLPKFIDSAEIEELNNQDTVIGYLGLAPQIQLSDIHQLEFVKRQKLSFILIAAGMLVVAALATLPLANRMVKPIRSLTSATRDLAAGRYGTRTKIIRSDELGQLSGDFNVLATTLEQNERARRQWTADISHELRTPLAVLRGEIEALQDKVRDITPHTLDTLHDEVMHLTRLVNDLYELSLSDLGALTYKKADTNVVEILQKAIKPFESRFLERGLSLKSDFSGMESVCLFADQERLLQLFTNLLENSLRYTDAGGELEIRADQGHDILTVHFQDSSPGVPKDDLPRLFDRLFRAEFSRNRAAGGAGLGLSICKNIVEAHDGRISAQTSPHGGLALAIEFPLVKSTGQPS